MKTKLPVDPLHVDSGSIASESLTTLPILLLHVRDYTGGDLPTFGEGLTATRPFIGWLGRNNTADTDVHTERGVEFFPHPGREYDCGIPHFWAP